MQINLQVLDAKVAKLLGRIPTALESELASAMVEMGSDHISQMGTRMARGRIGPAIGGGLVRTRSGALRRSFQREMRRSGGIGGLSTKLFSAGNPYANIQEFGGTITPKRAQNLAVPVHPSLFTASGVARYASPRMYPGKTAVVKTPKGGLWIVARKGKGKDAKTLWLWKLVKSVTLSGGLGWFDTWRHDRNRRAERIRVAGQRAIARAKLS